MTPKAARKRAVDIVRAHMQKTTFVPNELVQEITTALLEVSDLSKTKVERLVAAAKPFTDIPSHNEKAVEVNVTIRLEYVEELAAALLGIFKEKP